MQAVIMAGGKGTRLHAVARGVPKPMVKVGGVPVLERQIRSLVHYGIDEIIVVVGYLGHVIRDYFGNGSAYGACIHYVEEEKPLGTAGCFPYLKDIVVGPFVLAFGDVVFDVSWDRFVAFHENRNAGVSLFAHPNSHPYDSDLLVVGDDGKVTSILPKSEGRVGWYRNLVNGALYIVDSSVLDMVPKPVKTDFEAEVLKQLVPSGKVYAYRSSEYVKDMGTTERYAQVERDLACGIPAARNLSEKQKCIFLDRDGTLNELRGFVRRPEDLTLLPGASAAVRAINDSGYLCVVITNQPVLARGECSFKELERIHAKIETLLGQDGAYIDALYYCPHHPDGGYAGEVQELKRECSCRKPKTGLVKLAAKEMNIDLMSSWFVGDSTCDVLTGASAGMRTALLFTGEAGKDGKYEVRPTCQAEDLPAAVKTIFEMER